MSSSWGLVAGSFITVSVILVSRLGGPVSGSFILVSVMLVSSSGDLESHNFTMISVILVSSPGGPMIGIYTTCTVQQFKCHDSYIEKDLYSTLMIYVW